MASEIKKSKSQKAAESEFHAIGQNDFPAGRHQSDWKILCSANLFMTPTAYAYYFSGLWPDEADSYS